MSRPNDMYGYAKGYVDCADRDRLMALLNAVLGTDSTGYHVDRGGFQVEVRRNRDARAGDPSEFLDWPTTIEVENTSGPAVVVPLTALLRSSWADGIRIVLACSFEDELPWSGGIEHPSLASRPPL